MGQIDRLMGDLIAHDAPQGGRRRGGQETILPEKDTPCFSEHLGRADGGPVPGSPISQNAPSGHDQGRARLRDPHAPVPADAPIQEPTHGQTPDDPCAQHPLDMVWGGRCLLVSDTQTDAAAQGSPPPDRQMAPTAVQDIFARHGLRVTTFQQNVQDGVPGAVIEDMGDRGMDGGVGTILSPGGRAQAMEPMGSSFLAQENAMTPNRWSLDGEGESDLIAQDAGPDVSLLDDGMADLLMIAEKPHDLSAPLLGPKMAQSSPYGTVGADTLLSHQSLPSPGEMWAANENTAVGAENGKASTLIESLGLGGMATMDSGAMTQTGGNKTMFQTAMTDHQIAIAQQVDVSLRAMTFKEGRNLFHVSLTPAALGRLDIQVDISPDGHVNAVIHISRADTYDLLRQDQQLKESILDVLQEQGLSANMDDLSFTHGRDGEGQGERHPDGEGVLTLQEQETPKDMDAVHPHGRDPIADQLLDLHF